LPKQSVDHKNEIRMQTKLSGLECFETA